MPAARSLIVAKKRPCAPGCQRRRLVPVELWGVSACTRGGHRVPHRPSLGSLASPPQPSRQKPFTGFRAERLRVPSQRAAAEAQGASGETPFPSPGARGASCPAAGSPSSFPAPPSRAQGALRRRRAPRGPFASLPSKRARPPKSSPPAAGSAPRLGLEKTGQARSLGHSARSGDSARLRPVSVGVGDGGSWRTTATGGV